MSELISFFGDVVSAYAAIVVSCGIFGGCLLAFPVLRVMGNVFRRILHW